MDKLEAKCRGCDEPIVASSLAELILREAQHYADSRIAIPKGAGRFLKVHTCTDFYETPPETRPERARIRSFAGHDWVLKTGDGDILTSGRHRVNPYVK